MLEPTTKEIADGLSVTYYQLGVRAAMKLDLKVIRIAAPVIKAIDGLKGSVVGAIDELKDKSVETLLPVVEGVLNTLDDATVDSLVFRSLEKCVVARKGAAPVNILKPEDVDTAFEGSIMSVYKAMFEAWRYNQLTPFALLARTGSNTTTDTGDTSTSTPKGFGLKLER